MYLLDTPPLITSSTDKAGRTDIDHKAFGCIFPLPSLVYTILHFNSLVKCTYIHGGSNSPFPDTVRFRNMIFHMLGCSDTLSFKSLGLLRNVLVFERK